jgi:hypothetical protein
VTHRRAVGWRRGARRPPSSDETERRRGRGGEARADFERGPVVLAAAEGDEDALAAADRSGEDGDGGGRALEHCRQICRHAFAVQPRRRVEQDELDVVGGSEADHVRRRVVARERSDARTRRGGQGQLGGGALDLLLAGE